MKCPICGSHEVEYLGVDDGGGNFGDALCDYWRCAPCDLDFEGDCEGVGADDDGNF